MLWKSSKNPSPDKVNQPTGPNRPLRRINERSYIQTYGDGKTVEWKKRLHLIHANLCNIKAQRSLHIYHPEGQIIGQPHECGTDEEAASERAKENSDEQLSMRLEDRILGTCILDENHLISFICDDGSITDRSEAIQLVNVELKPTENTSEFGKGKLHYCNNSYSDPLYLEFLIPSDPLKNLWNDLTLGRFSDISISMNIDVFQSVHGVLLEPDVWQGYAIDGQTSYAYLNWLSAFRSIPGAPIKDQDGE